jgi:hypothetical protein
MGANPENPVGLQMQRTRIVREFAFVLLSPFASGQALTNPKILFIYVARILFRATFCVRRYRSPKGNEIPLFPGSTLPLRIARHPVYVELAFALREGAGARTQFASENECNPGFSSVRSASDFP